MSEEQPVSFRSTRTIITVGVVLLFIFIVLIVVLAITSSSSGSDVGPTIEPPEQCFNVVCPPAEKGDKGEPGKDGQNGMCLANPLCEKGDKGDPGKDGSDAVCQTCPRGFPGEDGKDGVCIQDCKDGKDGLNGTCTEPCVDGAQGPPGECLCFNITSIEFDEVTINESLNLNGTIECAEGTTIDPTCLLSGSCPDFSPCDIQAKSLLLKDGSPTRLQTGEFGGLSTGQGEVLLGDPTTVGVSDHIMNFINAYGNTMYLKSRYGATIQAGVGSSILFNIIAGGPTSTLQLQSSHIARITANTEIENMAGTRHSIEVGTSTVTTEANSHVITSQNIILESNAISFQKSSVIGFGGPLWFDINTLQSLDCSVTPAVPLLGTPAMHFYEDIIHGPESRIITSKMDGFQVIGPNVEVCGGSIKSGTSTLSIESTISNNVMGESVCIDDPEGLDLKDTFIYSSTTNQTDIRSSITNNAPGESVCIDDPEGLDTKDTYIYSSTTNQTDIRSSITNNAPSESVCIDDEEGLDLKDTFIYSSTTGNITVKSDNTLVVNTILGPGSININGVVIDEDGTITTPGSINTLGPVNGVGGSCCTSDLRMKESITSMNTSKSLDRIMHLKPIEYRWKSEILKQDHWMKDTVVRGFGAQEVEPLIPGAVHKRKKQVGDVVYSDFHTLDKTEMIPDLIAAVQELYKQNIELRMELNKLKK